MLQQTIGQPTGRLVSSPWLDTPRAADYLCMKPGSLRTFRSIGKGPRFHKAGRLVRYHVNDLDAFARGENSHDK